MTTSGSMKAGDVVTWMLPHNLPHIGLVTGQKSRSGTPLVVHNIGRGGLLVGLVWLALAIGAVADVEKAGPPVPPST